MCVDNWHADCALTPEQYTLFTPLLPSATVGTVEVRSLVAPLRKIIARVFGHYIQAACVDIDVDNRLLEIAQPGSAPFYLRYDKCIIAVGSVSNTHGVPGLEHGYQLKTIPDAQAIRRRIMENLEHAALPGVDADERNELLNFVICGGGPTGVEFASELYDMINEDVLQYVRVHLTSSRWLLDASRKVPQGSAQGRQGPHHPVARPHPEHLCVRLRSSCSLVLTLGRLGED
jgi:NADH dehydrogenase